MPITDLARAVAGEMYDEERLWELLESFGCRPVSAAAGAAFLSSGEHPLGYVAEWTPNAASWDQADSVLCSTCIDHCGGDSEKLAATVVSDLVHAAAVATHLSLPLVGFIPVGQEIRLQTDGSPRVKDWLLVADRVQQLFDELDLPAGSQVRSTHEDDVWDALTRSAADRTPVIPTCRLDGLYHLTDDSYFPAGTPFNYYYAHYRVNAAQYDVAVLTELFGYRRPVVVENLQQVKAIFLAEEISGGLGGALLTVPAPGRSLGVRATRSAPDAFYSLADFLKGRSALGNELLDIYWECVRDGYRALSSQYSQCDGALANERRDTNNDRHELSHCQDASDD